MPGNRSHIHRLQLDFCQRVPAASVKIEIPCVNMKLLQTATQPLGEVIPKSRAASEKALQLDEGLAEAHSSLGWVKWIYYWD